MKFLKKLTAVLLLLAAADLHAQVLITDQQLDLSVNPNATMQLRSANNNKGLLMPKIALTGILAASPLTAHVAGMTVYNTQTAGTYPNNVVPGFYYNDGVRWNRVAASKPVIGDVKQSAAIADHGGWYLLDGRNISTLPLAARAYAVGLGFLTTLPDASDKYLKAKTGSEVLGSAGGSNSFTIGQANLPNVTFTGTAVSAGSHSHSYNDRGIGTGNSQELNAIQVADNTTATLNTNSTGAHTHTFSVNTGGSGTPKTFLPTHVVVNTFVYLDY